MPKTFFFPLLSRGNDFIRAQLWSAIQAGNGIPHDFNSLWPSSSHKKKQRKSVGHRQWCSQGKESEDRESGRELCENHCLRQSHWITEPSSKDSKCPHTQTLSPHQVSKITVDYIRKSYRTSFLWGIVCRKVSNQDEKWKFEDTGNDN